MSPRYIARFIRGGFPELYAVMDTHDHSLIGEPKPYHDANDEAGARNDGSWGKPQEVVLDFNTITGWTGALSSTP